MNAGAAPGQIKKSTVVSLSEAGLSEEALERMIEEDPLTLGLGDVRVLESQRRQEKGRLDLLLEDDEQESRFEVELMLGSLDESHLIRTVEYWDVERRRYPGYQHCAVIVAEDVTSRFLNVIQLFSGAVPIIVIQANCIKVENSIALSFIRLLDSRKLRRDDRADIKAKAVDRGYWLSYVGPKILGIADECLQIINSHAKRKRNLNYNQQYIGLTDGAQANNFVYFSPKKSFIRISASISPVEPWTKRLEETSLNFKVWEDGVKVSVTPQTFEDNRAFLIEVLQEAVKQDEG
jgi:hypothetical protein